MGDVVNLNQFRKKRERTLKMRRSAENRARTGRTRAEQRVTQTEAARTDAALDRKRIERESDEPGGRGGRRPDID